MVLPFLSQADRRLDRKQREKTAEIGKMMLGKMMLGKMMLGKMMVVRSPAADGNAVKHSLTRKKACERIVAEFVRIRNARKSSEFSRIRLRKCFTALR
jgi:hypothetical protein